MNGRFPHILGNVDEEIEEGFKEVKTFGRSRDSGIESREQGVSLHGSNSLRKHFLEQPRKY